MRSVTDQGTQLTLTVAGLSPMPLTSSLASLNWQHGEFRHGHRHQDAGRAVATTHREPGPAARRAGAQEFTWTNRNMTTPPGAGR